MRQRVFGHKSATFVGTMAVAFFIIGADIVHRELIVPDKVGVLFFVVVIHACVFISAKPVFLLVRTHRNLIFFVSMQEGTLLWIVLKFTGVFQIVHTSDRLELFFVYPYV